MTRGQGAPTSRACGLLALVCGAVLFTFSAPLAHAAPRCLTPAVGHAFENLVAAGALQPVLQSGFTLKGVGVRATQIEVEIEDGVHRSYGITLALPESQGGKPDGEGDHFLFFLAASPGPPNREATTALLALASVFDHAFPETALECPARGDHAPPEERRCPRALALASALVEVAVEVAVLLAAILFGLRAIRSQARLS